VITDVRRIGLLDTWLYVLVCFALASLACAAKNFLSVSLQGTPVCGVLCPSIFGARGFPLPDSLDWLFAVQIGAEAQLQALFDNL